MQSQFEATKYVLIAGLILIGLALACSSSGGVPPPLTPVVIHLTPTAGSGGPATVQEQLSQIDEVLGQFMSTSFAYNAPTTMKLNDNTTVELLLNPSMTTEDLGSQIQESGAVTTGTINITAQMKAELIAQDPDAFVIRSLHDNAVQVISGTDTTRWAWIVTAKKSGAQSLIVIIYRLINYNGQDSWREVRAYRSDIEIQVTLAQRMQSIDWKWVVGIIITALLIPAFWRFMDSRKKKSKDRSR